MSYMKKIKCLIEQVNNIISFKPKLDYDPVTGILTGTFANGKDDSTPLPLQTSTLDCEDLENCQVIETIQQDIEDVNLAIPDDISDLTDASNLLFSGDYNDLSNQPNIPANTSDLNNDSNFIACSDLALCQEIINIVNSIPEDVSDLTDTNNLFFDKDYNSLDNLPNIPTDNSEIGNGANYISCEDLEYCQEIIDIKDSIPTDVSDLSDDEELLFSGDYNDLDNKPTIPTDVSDLSDNSNLFFDGDYNSLDNLPNIPTNNSELLNDSNYLTCEDLEYCQEIIDIKNSIPTDVSDLSDTNKILLEYKGEQSSAPLSPQKGWFYKNIDNGVMYYFDGTNWVAYAESRREWGLQFFNQGDIIQLEATHSNIATFTSGVGTDVGTIEVSTDGVTYSPLTFPFSPSVGTLYFKRSINLSTGVYTISE